MSFITIIFNILIGPLKLIFEVIFNIANKFTGHSGLSIIMLSLAMNVLVLPLYRQADAMQERARDVEAKLHNGIAHIKKVFTGDERMMMLQTYYRQNNYSPLSALSGSVSLLLEIPFFMAAYQFLSNLQGLKGVSLGPIKDLSQPDGLLLIGGIAINLLPILMTLINVISSAIYLKGFPLKTKIQLYAMAAFFLVFLYTSPAGLVFYWTLNNLFSLVKTIFYKIKNPKKVLNILLAVVGTCVIAFSVLLYNNTLTKKLFVCIIGFALIIPIITSVVKIKLPASKKVMTPNKKLFLWGSIFLTVLIGLLIPSTFIAASPQEYVDISYFYNPLWYVLNAFCFAVGTFLVWLRVFYWLANDNGKILFEKLICILSAITLVNYMFFGTKLGIISSSLKYDSPLMFSAKEQIINVVIMLAIVVILYFVVTKWKKAAVSVLLVAVIALGGMSGLNIVKTNKSINAIQTEETKNSTIPTIELSKNGKNVFVIMLDRAMGAYIPYIMKEKPELKNQFDGFTYYSNTISYGPFTNFTTPTIFGGYEYTPIEMNKRDTESLAKKQNEALLLMPDIFSKNGFKVTASDPVYANYNIFYDTSIYNDYIGKNFKAQITHSQFSSKAAKQEVIDNNLRNFYCFSLMKTMPVSIQSVLYDNGNYNQAASLEENEIQSPQSLINISQAIGAESAFISEYNTMTSMPNMTKFLDDDTNTFMYMVNDLPHLPTLLQTPDYVPAQIVDNTQYDAEHADRFTIDGKTLPMDSNAMIHYHANMSALLRLGEWFDYLRENDAYDNTRIIIVSDHGTNHLKLEGRDDFEDQTASYFGYYNPLLMVKDFDSTGFNTSDAFMTNADVPTLATADIIKNPTNPFTGKPINSNEKTAHDQMIISSNEWSVGSNNGNTFAPARWISVKDNVWDTNQWEFYDEDIVLKEHKLPN